MLNRGVVMLTPRQPYLDWASRLDDSGLIPDPLDEKTVYLLPDYESEDEALDNLKEVYEEIFEKTIGSHLNY